VGSAAGRRPQRDEVLRERKTCTEQGGWSVGQAIDQLDELGNYPSWETARSRYWETRAANAASGEFSSQNLANMKAGNPPRVRAIVLDLQTGSEVEILASKELHHITGRTGPFPHAASNLQELWPWEHAAIDPFRYTGYEFLRFK
jgi:hypothetical protein